MPEALIRGNTIKYIRVPEEVIDKVQEESARAKEGRQQTNLDNGNVHRAEPLLCTSGQQHRLPAPGGIGYSASKQLSKQAAVQLMLLSLGCRVVSSEQTSSNGMLPLETCIQSQRHSHVCSASWVTPCHTTGFSSLHPDSQTGAQQAAGGEGQGEGGGEQAGAREEVEARAAEEGGAALVEERGEVGDANSGVSGMWGSMGGAGGQAGGGRIVALTAVSSSFSNFLEVCCCRVKHVAGARVRSGM
jgi:hypothetical protein